MKYYITFGENHVHNLDVGPKGENESPLKLVDKDTVVIINCKEDIFEAILLTQRLFGNKYSTIVSSKPDMDKYSKGLVEVNL